MGIFIALIYKSISTQSPVPWMCTRYLANIADSDSDNGHKNICKKILYKLDERTLPHTTLYKQCNDYILFLNLVIVSLKFHAVCLYK